MVYIKVLSNIERILTKVTHGAKGLSQFTANQQKVFYKVYAIPYMWDLLEHKDREIIFNFVCVCNSLINQIVKQSNLDKAYN